MTRLVIVGGSDAGISAALRAREVDPSTRVDLLLSDRWPNYSICGLPYLINGEVADTTNLAHRTLSEIQAAGIDVHVEHHVVSIDADDGAVLAHDAAGATVRFEYDALILATGAVPQRPPIAGLELDGVHLLHTVDDALIIADRLAGPQIRHAVIVGAGYIGLEMADALRHRDVDVTLVERLPAVMPTVDTQIGAQVRATLERRGVRVLVDTTVSAVERSGGNRRFPGVLGTQVVKVFDLAHRQHRAARQHRAQRALRRPYAAIDRSRPQALLPRSHRPHDPRLRRRALQPAPRSPDRRSPDRPGRQAHRCVRHRAAPRDDARRAERSRPQLHPTLRHTMDDVSSRTPVVPSRRNRPAVMNPAARISV